MSISTQQRIPWPPRRGARPSWWVVLDGQRIGWVEEVYLRGARLPFYRATGFHPLDEGEVVLELSTDFNERVRTIAAFRLNPMTSAQHLPRRYQADA